jgi:hypothetical protein
MQQNKKVKLKKKDAEFLIANLPEIAERLLLRQRVKDDADVGSAKIEITLTAHQIDSLTTLLLGLLTEIGLNQDHEPNETGLYIESLIDLISH